MLTIKVPNISHDGKAVVVFSSDTQYRKMFPDVQAWVKAKHPMCLVIDYAFKHNDDIIMVSQDAAYGDFYILVKSPHNEMCEVSSYRRNDMMFVKNLVISYTGEYNVYELSKVTPELMPEEDLTFEVCNEKIDSFDDSRFTADIAHISRRAS